MGSVIHDSIDIVVLAAGRASRMGREKLLLPLAGRPVIRYAAETARSLRCGEMVVVSNPNNSAAIEVALDGIAVRVVQNSRYREGIGSSIAVGAAAVRSTCAGMLLVQGDQPLVTTDMLKRVVDVWTRKHPTYVAASYAGVTTTPVLFSRALVPELVSLGGDRGAREVLERHRGGGCMVAFQRWRGMDMDTDEDYERVKDMWCHFLAGRPDADATRVIPQAGGVQ